MFQIPLADEQLLEFVDNQENIFEVKIGGEFDAPTALIYISNLNMKCNCFFDDEETKLEFIKEYLETDKMVSIPNIEKMVVKLLLYGSGFSTETLDCDLTNDECEKFFKGNTELMSRIYKFVDSMLLYSVLCHMEPESKEEFLKNTTIKVIDDKEYVGLNIVNVFKYNELCNYYMFTTIEEQTYFTRQFNDYMYNGSNLYNYFHDNVVLKMVTMMLLQGE